MTFSPVAVVSMIDSTEPASPTAASAIPRRRSRPSGAAAPSRAAPDGGRAHSAA